MLKRHNDSLQREKFEIQTSEYTACFMPLLYTKSAVKKFHRVTYIQSLGVF